MHKKQKEHLFDNAIRGIIESVENISKHKLLEKGLICMGKTDHNAHSVYLMYYHLIMVVKYRRKVIDNPISERAKRSLLESEFLPTDSWRRSGRSNPSIY